MQLHLAIQINFAFSPALKMHILIIGGSGRTGKVTVEECLQRGHTVTALVRKASSITQRCGLAIVEGKLVHAAYMKDLVTNIL